jgi:hypothetical protein
MIFSSAMRLGFQLPAQMVAGIVPRSYLDGYISSDKNDNFI